MPLLQLQPRIFSHWLILNRCGLAVPALIHALRRTLTDATRISQGGIALRPFWDWPLLVWALFSGKNRQWGWAPMKDYQASIEKLRRDAAEAALIRDLAADKTKREMFDRLHQHLNWPMTSNKL